MSVVGLKRYLRLWQHIANPNEYILRRGDRRHRKLQFATRPYPVHFQVTASLYQVFKELFMQDVYEINRLVAQLPSQPVVIDIGANAGFFAVQLLSKLDRATIYAYEPMPANIDVFREMLSQNPRLQHSVQLFQMAVTGTYRPVLHLFAEAADNSQVVASVFDAFHKSNTHQIAVRCITLSAIIEDNSLETIDLLKIDCEGSEYDILYNTDPALLRRVRRLVMEVHDVDTDRHHIKALDTYLQSVGFQTTHTPINHFCHSLEAVMTR